MIRLEGVTRRYRSAAGDRVALDAADLEVARGEVFGVVGRSGAGKSTLIRTINRLETPDAGKVFVDGREITAMVPAELRAARRGIGMIFQHFNLLNAKTIEDNVAFPLRLEGRPAVEVKARTAELLERLGLAEHAKKHPAQLSGGQKQRVGIARALACGPSVLLCDEATSALDPETTEDILTLLDQLNRELGLTIVLITHEMSVIRAVADDVAVIDRGAIVERGTVYEVFTRPQAEVTRSLLAGEVGLDLPAGLAERISADPRPGGVPVLRLSLRGAQADTAIIARLARETGIEAVILAGAVDEIAGQRFGSLALGLSPGPDVTARAQAYLAGLGIQAEFLGYLPPAQEVAKDVAQGSARVA